MYCTSLYSQNRIGYINESTTLSECKTYFKNNILDLDPIEGIYDVDITMQGKNSFQTFPATYDSDTYVIYKTADGKYAIKGLGGNIYIKRIGETNAYNYVRKWSDVNVVDEVRFLLSNEIQFRINTEVPAAKIKHDQGRSYQAGMKVTIVYNGIKEYPTGSMYASAQQEATKKAAEEIKRKQEIEAKKAGWTGSGFALKDGYIVTNFHVVEDATNISVRGVNGDFLMNLKAEVVATDKYNDIAVLKINDSRFSGLGTIPYSIKKQIADVAEDIFVLGYPLTSTMGDEIKYTTGVISSRTGFQGDVSQYQISAPIQPGNSGGPLFDSKGNLIGIVSAKHLGAENVGYAIKTSYLNILLETVLDIEIPQRANLIENIPRTEQIKRLKQFVYLIECKSNELLPNSSSSQPATISPELNTKNIVLNIGESKQIEIHNLAESESSKWMSLDENIATVSSEGVVTAKAKGQTIIRVFAGHHVLECVVKVNSPISTTIENRQIFLNKGDRIQLDPTEFGVIQRKSLDIINYTDDGIITANKLGKAKIWTQLNEKVYQFDVIVFSSSYNSYKGYFLVEKPYSSKYQNPVISINKIEMNSTYTKVYFQYLNIKGKEGVISVDPNISIKAFDKSFKLVEAIGIPLFPKVHNFKKDEYHLDFCLIFEGIPKHDQLKSIDIIEPNSNGELNFMQVIIR